jgi:hypothetical protein
LAPRGYRVVRENPPRLKSDKKRKFTYETSDPRPHCIVRNRRASRLGARRYEPCASRDAGSVRSGQTGVQSHRSDGVGHDGKICHARANQEQLTRRDTQGLSIRGKKQLQFYEAVTLSCSGDIDEKNEP